jgi:photosystem II stability/assembly factor-like uncharacterized protein
MKVFTRKRLIVVGIIAAFVVVISAIGAVSRSSPATTPVVAVTGAGGVPSELWYWTMAVSPSDPNVLLLGTNSGIQRSTDGGKTWAPVGPATINTTSLVSAGNSIYAGGVSGKQVGGPVIKKNSARTASDGGAVIEVSTDNGATWKLLHPRGLPNVAVQSLAVDSAKGNALYAVLNTGKLYRSTDGAQSFQMVSSKLGAPAWALAITQNGHFVAGSMDNGSYLSTDGKKFQRSAFTDSRAGHMVMEYAVQPTDTTRVLMTSYGVEMSTDSGKTWHVALKSNVMFGPVAWAPNTAGVAYAIGFDRSLWRSDDGGKTWKNVT